MGLLEELKPNMYSSCPECGVGEIKEETSGSTLERLYCEECGYEPEYGEALENRIGSSVGNSRNTANNNSTHICRECHKEVSPDVQRCPECGYKPEKKGILWKLVTVVMIFNPIGWAMGAKSASDGIKSAKGVTKTVNKKGQSSDSETGEDNSKTLTEKIHELRELREKGLITESEFNNKKEELLEEL
jgi:DNA-directed RNA polymerase subunit M/transcription elongation factor TFIIS